MTSKNSNRFMLDQISNLLKQNKPIKAIKSTRVAIDGKLQPATIRINDGKISDISSFDNAEIDVIDGGNLVVFPGIIDPHVHLNEPGNTDWEGFESGTKAAAAGGITTLFDMPLNSIPCTVDNQGLKKKQQASEGKLSMNVGFHGGYFDGNEKGLKELLTAGIKTIKVFLINSGLPEFPQTSFEALEKIAPLLIEANATLLVHAEVEQGRNDQDRKLGAAAKDTIEWEKSRPPSMEIKAIEDVIEISRKTGLKVHIVHVATKEALPIIAKAKADGITNTAETCPHYLFFDAKEAAKQDALLKCAPPVRNKDDQIALIEALLDGTLDLVATDHSPSPLGLKMPHRSFAESWGGVSSLQYLLPVIWTLFKGKGHAPESLISRLCEAPARLLNLEHRKGKIAVGYDADLVFWNPEKSLQQGNTPCFHRHQVNPYSNYLLFGSVVTTICQGRISFHHGIHNQECIGQLL